MAEIEDKIRNLQMLQPFLIQDDENMKTLISFNQKLLEIEDQISNLGYFFDNEIESLNSSQDLLVAVESQNKILRDLLDAIPEDRFARPVEEVEVPAVKVTAKAEPKIEMDSPKPKKKRVTIDEVTPEEFEKVPSYISTIH